MVGAGYNAELADLRASGKAAKAVAETVKKNSGATTLTDSSEGLAGTTSATSLKTMSTTWSHWAASWSKSMTDYGQGLQESAKNYAEHDDQYSKDFDSMCRPE